MNPNRAFAERHNKNLEGYLVIVGGKSYVRAHCELCECSLHISLSKYDYAISKGANVQDIRCTICKKVGGLRLDRR